jgi:hypothetical protein
MNTTLNFHCRRVRYWRLAAMVICLLQGAVLVADSAQRLLAIRQDGKVLGPFSMAALEAAGPVRVKVEDDTGQSADYIGVPISTLLESVGVSLGKAVRGERLAEFVMVRAADGYRVLFSLAEMDPLFPRAHAAALHPKERHLSACSGRANSDGRCRRKATGPPGQAGHVDRIGTSGRTAPGPLNRAPA